MSEEIRLVTRQETFNDLAVRELAKNRAACICRLQFKRCDKGSCKSCPVGMRYRNCTDQMSDYDVLRLQSYIAENYAEYSKYPEQWYSHNKYVAFYIGIALFVFVILFGFFGIFLGLLAIPHDSVSFRYNNEVISVLKYTHENICDLDRDDKVDCCDYAIFFKMTWDVFYPKLRNKCEIVRNYNPGKMNHLFVKVDNRHIETRTDDVNDVRDIDDTFNYFIEDVWGAKYDPKKNRYGETTKWLNTIK